MIREDVDKQVGAIKCNMTVRFPGIWRALKLSFVIFAVSICTAILWLSKNRPQDGDLVSQRKIPFYRETNQSLFALYRKKLENISLLKQPRATAIRPCKDEPSTDRACVDTDCPDPVLQPSESVLKGLLLRQYAIPDKYMKVINMMTNGDLDKTSISLLSAVSTNHFYEWLGLLESLIHHVFPVFPNFRFYVYDLGLKDEQINAIKIHCRFCHVRTFPFSDLPLIFSNLKSYTWKPLLIQAHMKTSQYVIWMDSSVRFLTGNLTRVFERVKERGMLISSSHVSTALHTDPRMYEYFGLTPCQMSRFKELEGTFLLFHNNLFTARAIVYPWLSCAFAPNCMYPFGAIPVDKRHYDCKTNTRRYGSCHRFDQSALTTILALIYGDKIGSILLKKNVININKRGHKLKYFPTEKEII